MSEGARKAVTDVVILIIESGLLREGVKVWEVDNLVRRIVARLTGRTVEQVAEVITEEILSTPQEPTEWRKCKEICGQCGVLRTCADLGER